MQAAFAYLRQFSFQLYYKKGKEMADVDALSRAPVEEVVVVDVSSVPRRWHRRV